MMRYITITLLLLFFSAIKIQAQEKQQRDTDSLLAVKDVVRAKELVDIPEEKMGIIVRATMASTNARREVFRRYWKTPEFLDKLAEADNLREAAYLEVLGEKKYRRYKESLQQEFYKEIKRQQELAAGKADSVTVN